MANEDFCGVQTVAERSASTSQQEHVSNVAWLLAVAVRECVRVRVCNEAVMLDQGGGGLSGREGGTLPTRTFECRDRDGNSKDCLHHGWSWQDRSLKNDGRRDASE
jgi:hypothetical protein